MPLHYIIYYHIHHIISYHIISYIISNHIISCHVMPYHTIPYHTIPYHTTLYHNILNITYCTSRYIISIPIHGDWNGGPDSQPPASYSWFNAHHPFACSPCEGMRRIESVMDPVHVSMSVSVSACFCLSCLCLSLSIYTHTHKWTIIIHLKKTHTYISETHISHVERHIYYADF